ncbi:hypothetical protein [Devosia sp.]|uniref:hypothetical protein n=1 Tax=Devosia sp. TaxID=1871048 RepID=UPI0032657A52
MKAMVVGLLLAGLAVTGGYAAPVTDTQKAEFKKVCLSISHDEALCACKVEAAPKLIDERMMGYVIAGMKGAGNAPDDVQREWNNYVAKSNQICKPNY